MKTKSRNAFTNATFHAHKPPLLPETCSFLPPFDQSPTVRLQRISAPTITKTNPPVNTQIQAHPRLEP